MSTQSIYHCSMIFSEFILITMGQQLLHIFTVPRLFDDTLSFITPNPPYTQTNTPITKFINPLLSKLLSNQ
ncbi:hypothetical protein AHAS_Ahas01G0176200 [Arachis hypogaea]